jgi:DNA-binding response OmpR family regulator
MKKILIIDDSAKIRKLLRTTLEKRNFDIIEASNGIDAIIELEKEPVDLVLMDVVMPNLGGLASLIGFKEIFKKTKVVLMTGKLKEDAEELRIAARDLGVRHVLFKPFKNEKLFEVIKEQLDTDTGSN